MSFLTTQPEALATPAAVVDMAPASAAGVSVLASGAAVGVVAVTSARVVRRDKMNGLGNGRSLLGQPQNLD